MSEKAADFAPGERRLNGVQTTGREYRNLSEPSFTIRRTNNVNVTVRDGTTLLADLFQPDSTATFQRSSPSRLTHVRFRTSALRSASSKPARPTSSFPAATSTSSSTPAALAAPAATDSLLDQQEREDLYDLVEWVGVQPWCDGNVGMLGVSYFAMAQLGAAAMKPPHLKAIAPLLTTDDIYDAVWHHGLLNAGFISAWLSRCRRDVAEAGFLLAKLAHRPRPRRAQHPRRSTRGCRISTARRSSPSSKA